MQTSEINRFDFLIMFCLQKCGATSPVKAVTINELQGYCPSNTSYSTFYRSIKYLCKNQYISYGLKDGKNDTYYLNKNGIDLIKGCC